MRITLFGRTYIVLEALPRWDEAVVEFVNKTVSPDMVYATGHLTTEGTIRIKRIQAVMQVRNLFPNGATMSLIDAAHFVAQHWPEDDRVYLAQQQEREEWEENYDRE